MALGSAVWRQRAQRLVSITQTLGVDAWRLTVAVVKSKTPPISNHATNNTIRDILVSHQQTHNNQVALQLLKLQREVGLVQYYGFPTYIRQHAISLPLTVDRPWLQNLLLVGTNSSISSEQSPPPLASSSSTRKQARVAFMITMAQKQVLQTQLGYQVNDIKQLTPLEALLIVENQISKHETYKEVVQALVEENKELERQAALEHEEELRKEEEHQESIQRVIQDEAPHTNNKETIHDEVDRLLLLSSENSTNPKEDGELNAQTPVSLEEGVEANLTSMEEETTTTKYSSSHGDKEWFEVLEIDGDGNTKVVALFDSPKEAEEFVQIKQEIAASTNGKADEIRYQVHKKT